MQQLSNLPEDLLYLEENLDKANSRLQRCQGSITEYTQVSSTLATFPDQPRRHVMASVCNGLAYFDAVVENTNSFLVLLGDSWFAERSSKQCVAIAQRRLEFLRSEEKVFKAQVKQIEETIKMAQDEGTAAKKDNERQHDEGKNEEEFDECDQLNLRELELLEEEMLRETNGGEWDADVLHAKIRERQEAKKRRRLEVEAGAQRTVGKALLTQASPTNATVNSSTSAFADHDDQSRGRHSAAPLHPGQIGIVEQLEMLNKQLGLQNKHHQPVSAKPGAPTLPQSKIPVVVVDDDDGDDEEKKQRRHEKKNPSRADGTGEVKERTGSTKSMMESSKNNANLEPKKVSLFKQRKAGNAE